MARLPKLLSLLFCLVALLPPAAIAQSPSTAEREARAAFGKWIDAAKKRDTAQFKALIASRDLREMEAMEKEKAGYFAFMMELFADTDPAQFKADVGPSSVTFSREVVTNTPDHRGTERSTFTLVREGNAWKLGAPP